MSASAWKMRSPSGVIQSSSDSSLVSPEDRKSLDPALMVEQGHHAVAGASQGPGGV